MPRVLHRAVVVLVASMTLGCASALSQRNAPRCTTVFNECIAKFVFNGMSQGQLEGALGPPDGIKPVTSLRHRDSNGQPVTFEVWSYYRDGKIHEFRFFKTDAGWVLSH
jgi:hypothetical protein